LPQPGGGETDRIFEAQVKRRGEGRRRLPFHDVLLRPIGPVLVEGGTQLCTGRSGHFQQQLAGIDLVQQVGLLVVEARTAVIFHDRDVLDRDVLVYVSGDPQLVLQDLEHGGQRHAVLPHPGHGLLHGFIGHVHTGRLFAGLMHADIGKSQDGCAHHRIASMQCGTPRRPLLQVMERRAIRAPVCAIDRDAAVDPRFRSRARVRMRGVDK